MPQVFHGEWKKNKCKGLNMDPIKCMWVTHCKEPYTLSTRESE